MSADCIVTFIPLLNMVRQNEILYLVVAALLVGFVCDAKANPDGSDNNGYLGDKGHDGVEDDSPDNSGDDDDGD